MGQHTWFYKDKDVFDKCQELSRQIDELEDKGLFDDVDFFTLNYNFDKLDKFNEAEYHDLFRTSKRNTDGTYCDDVITSKEQCFSWIKENEKYVSNINYQLLNEFWDKYPKGVIAFS